MQFLRYRISRILPRFPGTTHEYSQCRDNGRSWATSTTSAFTCITGHNSLRLQDCLPGGAQGKKSGPVRGVLGIRFTQTEDDDLRGHLADVVSRQRTDPLEFDIRLDDGTELLKCTIGGALGSSIGASWFLLEL